MYPKFWSDSLCPKCCESMQLHGISILGSIILPHLIAILLETNLHWLMNSIWIFCDEQQSVDGGITASSLVLATGPGNLPAVRVQTAKTVQFGYKHVQKPDPLHLVVPNPDPYPSTHRSCRVWLDTLVPISSSSFQVFLFMVALWYSIANRKILTLVYCCSFLLHWLPI